MNGTDVISMRARIGAALATVEGIDGRETPPRIPARGQAWAEWRWTDPIAMTGTEATWDVHVALPGALTEDQVLAGDGLLEAVLEVLEQLGVVSRVEPTTLVIEQGGAQMPCLTYTLTTVQ